MLLRNEEKWTARENWWHATRFDVRVKVGWRKTRNVNESGANWGAIYCAKFIKMNMLAVNMKPFDFYLGVPPPLSHCEQLRRKWDEFHLLSFNCNAYSLTHIPWGYTAAWHIRIQTETWIDGWVKYCWETNMSSVPELREKYNKDDSVTERKKTGP